MNELYEKALNTEVYMYGDKIILRQVLINELCQVVEDTECYSGKSFAEHISDLAPALMVLDDSIARIEPDYDPEDYTSDYIPYEIKDWTKFNQILKDLINYQFSKR